MSKGHLRHGHLTKKDGLRLWVRTGLIDHPKPELFQVYCDLAKDISGFDSATFSLFDAESQCSIAATGRDELHTQPVLR